MHGDLPSRGASRFPVALQVGVRLLSTSAVEDASIEEQSAQEQGQTANTPEERRAQPHSWKVGYITPWLKHPPQPGRGLQRPNSDILDIRCSEASCNGQLGGAPGRRCGQRGRVRPPPAAAMMLLLSLEPPMVLLERWMPLGPPWAPTWSAGKL
jgi:hypothetical protein